MSRPLPTHVYVDTSVVVAAVFPEVPQSAASVAFCEILADQHINVYFSQIIRLELSQAVRNLATRPGQVQHEMWSDFQVDQWGTNPFVRRRWLEFGSRQFEGLIGQFATVIEIPFDLATWRSSLDVMATSGLRSLDAIHVATARRAGLKDLATLDEHFNRIRDPRIWLIRNA